VTELVKEKFEELCRADLLVRGADADGIGTYNEKRIHRILKRLITENAECYEIKLGRYVADILLDGTVFEIQTGSFRTLSEKVKFYLEHTDYEVCIVHPVISEKTLIRAERDTGEIMRVSRSPKKGRQSDLLAELYHIADMVGNERLCVRVLYINAEEYRFSEPQRYRRQGRYECDLRPTELVGETVLRTLDDWRALIPKELCCGEFSTAEFEKSTHLSGRNRYYALNALLGTGLVSRRTDGKKNFYRVIE
jgi:hypothetical protein